MSDTTTLDACEAAVEDLADELDGTTAAAEEELDADSGVAPPQAESTATRMTGKQILTSCKFFITNIQWQHQNAECQSLITFQKKRS